MGKMPRFAQGVVFCLLAIMAVVGVVMAQDAQSLPVSPDSGGPQDWSGRHAIYTGNGAAEEILRLKDDPRFVHSVLQRYWHEYRNRTASSGTERSYSDDPGNNVLGPFDRPLHPRARNKHTRVDWSMSLGPNGGMAPGETPAVYTANYSTPSCTADFVVYTINATPGVGTQANLVGMNNLYANGAGTGFCAGTAPQFMFSYAIGSGGSVLSPVLSVDGTKVAWIEARTAANAFLHVTKWAANEGTTSTGPAAVSGTWSNGACTTAGTSCDFTLQYTNSTYPGCTKAFPAGNTHSDLYVDYASNTGYISANNGLLYHIKNIFSSTANPSIDFCIPVNVGFESKPKGAMSGPVYDPFLNEVFISDSEAIYAYKVNALTGSFTPAVPPSYTYGNAGSNYNYPTGPGPLVDMFNGYLYLFSTYDAAGNTSVTQLSTSLASASAVVVNLGAKSTNANPLLFYGAFDNNYFINGPKSAASTLYTCGTNATNANAQDLFAISFNPLTGAANTTPAMSNNTNISGPGGVKNGICSPPTEFYDGTNDRLFVGLGQPGSATGSNVVTMWNINTQLTNTSGSGGGKPTYSAIASGYLGGASGMSADNNAISTAQAENIYFSTLQAGTAATAVPGVGYNVNGIYTDGSTFSQTGGLDQDGNAYSSNLLGTSMTWNGATFTFGPANNLDAWQATTVTLPSGQFSTLLMLGCAVNGNLLSQSFVVNYTDGTNTTFTQSVSDWFTPQTYPGESTAATTAYRDVWDGSFDNRTFLLYGYSFALNPNKTVQSITLPAAGTGHDHVVVVLAMALASNCGGADYCAVKLTQGALQ